MKFTELSEKERAAFTENFYALWDENFGRDTRDTESPAPWGAPWEWAKDEATTPEKWFADNKKEIASLIDAEKAN